MSVSVDGAYVLLQPDIVLIAVCECECEGRSLKLKATLGVWTC